MNWKLRLKNKATLVALISAAVTFVYAVLSALGIAPAIEQDQVMAVAAALLTVLTALGVVVDPTTAGIGDSEQALTYEAPKAE